MKFLATLHTIKATPLGLLDMAYLVVILPLLIVIKLPMALFIIGIVITLIFNKTAISSSKVTIVFLLGVVAIFFSMYGTFNFQGLSRLKLFLELLIYILLVVVAMQRLTREINFYLLISPMLFLALSLFFFHGLLMLIYVIFEIFFLLWMILSHRMESTLLESFRASMVMFLYALPWVVLLFVFFPRISFEHANYGFKGERTQRMGHDGTMFLDNDALLVPSERIVMEVGFTKEIPNSSELYFRGSILYVDKKNHWEPLPQHILRKKRTNTTVNSEDIGYTVTLYPTQKRWLYFLEMPQSTDALKSSIDADLVGRMPKDIKEPLHYKAYSSLSSHFKDTLDAQITNVSKTFDTNSNLKTQKEATEIMLKYAKPTLKAAAVFHFFKQQALTYTLKPDLLDLNNTTDSFLFDKRKGYCVHFASSFVTMARMVGIPARIVTGYKADKSNSYNNYLAVKESDAHAWAELYIEGAWKRYETTSTAAYTDSQTSEQLRKKDTLFTQVNLYLMYVKYQVDTWILNYSNIRQLQLLKYAKAHPQFVFGFVVVILLLFLLSLFFISYFKRDKLRNEVLQTLQPLLHMLEKKGYLRKERETMHQYLVRYSEILPEKESKKKLQIEQIDSLYEEMTYAGIISEENKKRLKQLVKGLKL